MQRSQRIGLIAAAVIVAVVAVIVLSGGDDDSSDTDKPTATTPTEERPAGKPDEAPSPPPVTTIQVKGGKPVGGVEEIELDKGDTLQFRVKSDEEHEIHLHGYDIEKEVAAGGTVAYKLEADIEGIFEVEIEDLKEPIAEVRVNP